MPPVYPFQALQYLQGRGDASTLIAPPYDVLDAAGKAALRSKNAHNIVAIDLPHVPPRNLGPPAAYSSAAKTLCEWNANGILNKRHQPAMFAYRQTTPAASGPASSRCGMVVCVDTVPFGPRAGGGILPHEETFSGPKEDRLALMKATKTQLSPIFGLHPDEQRHATALIHSIMSARAPDMTARMDDGILHEVWTVSDNPTITAYQAALKGQDIFIADGHHRYLTALTYLSECHKRGDIHPTYPAHRTMMVLVGMSDPGLIIWPTHRVLGGMANYTFDAFLAAASPHMVFDPAPSDLQALDRLLDSRDTLGPLRVGLYDCATKRAMIATPKIPDPLAARFPEKPKAWRDLAVAYIQYIIVEQIAQPLLNAGAPIKWAFPHTIKEVADIGAGIETGAGGGKGFAQLAIIVRPTPLEAVRDVSRANQLMPQKSTFFYPKLATGLFMHPLE